MKSVIIAKIKDGPNGVVHYWHIVEILDEMTLTFDCYGDTSPRIEFLSEFFDIKKIDYVPSGPTCHNCFNFRNIIRLNT
jgi:hypothetical protein